MSSEMRLDGMKGRGVVYWSSRLDAYTDQKQTSSSLTPIRTVAIQTYQRRNLQTMTASFIKTSLYTRSLLSSPPAALPQIPTLAELRERVESIPVSIPSASVSDPKYSLPAYSNSPPPKYKKGWSFSSKMMKIAPNQVQGSAPGERNVPAMRGSGGYLRM